MVKSIRVTSQQRFGPEQFCIFPLDVSVSAEICQKLIQLEKPAGLQRKKPSSESCEEHCVSDLISVASPANRLRFHITALFYIINHSAHSSQRNRFTKNRITLSDNTHACHTRLSYENFL